MCEVAIRCDDGDFLTIALLGRSHPGIGPFQPGPVKEVPVSPGRIAVSGGGDY